jgi:hypothetical protein
MNNKPTNSNDVIDSRNIIERIEELEGELQTAHEQDTEDGTTNLDFEKWLLAVRADSSPAHCHELNDEVEELQELRQLAADCESSPDWNYGETLIREDYFTDYIEELINDCYEMPKQMNSGEWPYRHMTIDFCAAAEEAKADYFEVSFFGTVYLIRA